MKSKDLKYPDWLRDEVAERARRMCLDRLVCVDWARREWKPLRDLLDTPRPEPPK